jgi:hypothetical protein
MAEYKHYHGATGKILIEIEPDSGEGTGGNNLREAMRVIQDIANATFDEMQRLGEDKRPGEFEICFGLTAVSGGGMAISLVQERANFRIRMKWGGASGGELLSGLAEMPGSPPR